MILALIALAVLNLLLLLVLLLRKPARDERLAPLPESVIALRQQVETLRDDLRALRRDGAEHAEVARTAADLNADKLREEFTRNSTLLREEVGKTMAAFRADNSASAHELRREVKVDLETVKQRIEAHAGEMKQHTLESRDVLHRTLGTLSAEQRDMQEKLRGAVETGLHKLNEDNTRKLEEMRVTVDEKLNATLQTRLTESFGQVSTHLGEVQRGLGEMKELANGVSDLKRVFSNVKARGVIGEVQLRALLEQMLSREQYIENAVIREGTQERVEFAIRIPHPHGDRLFAIDSKFPLEDWERLGKAYEAGTREEIDRAAAAFCRAIRTEGKRICEKYIHEPVTLPYAIMFLPTEALYADVLRQPGLQDELQRECHVTIAGPQTLTAILTSLRLGFHSIALERKGAEVWRLLGTVKTEFGNFGKLMDKVNNQVGTVQNTLKKIKGKTTTINRRLRDVTATEAVAADEALALPDSISMATEVASLFAQEVPAGEGSR